MRNLKKISAVPIVLGFLLSFKPVKQEDYVPNAETAIKIAEAVWLPIYGKGICGDKPFVEGTLAKDAKGGVPYIEIQKSDGRILVVTHGK